MISGNRVLAIIPARGGSKGLPGKNIQPVNGKPLIAWTILEAHRSRYIDRTILSSDDEAIIRVARDWGCEAPFVRPGALAEDQTPTIDVVLDAIHRIPGYDIVVVLQPTSPLRTSGDIDGALELLLERNASACVSVTEPDKSPYWALTVDDIGKISPLLGKANFTKRRQDLPLAYVLNGAVYTAKTNTLMNTRQFVNEDTVAYVMPKERSFDIDTERDIAILEATKTA